MIEEIYALSLKYVEEANAYISSRGLENNFGGGYIPAGTKFAQYKFDGGVVFPLKVRGKLNGLMYRSKYKKQYIKILDRESKYPHIYGIDEALPDRSHIILTEAVLDCETLRQKLDTTQAISTLSSDWNPVNLAVCGLFDKVYTAFDNDKSGLKAFDVVEGYLQEYYPEVELEYLDYRGKDVNKFYEDRGLNEFRKCFINQIEELQ